MFARAAQDVLLDLSRGGFGQFGDEIEAVWHFEVRKRCQKKMQDIM